MLLIGLLDVYSFIVFGAVIASWVQLPPDNPIANFLYAMTEPLLGPIRSVLPDMGGLDFSPLVLLFAVRMLRGMLLSAAAGF
ncbi:MAG: YggT family protein [Acidobacteria bacterium]|nr:YggT family protein [Acidobacteriota bacterium]MYH27670.1 YggT family protein [Acidobacteriota bacterium]MYK87715.1 YggT family protein [Acidobacteriota bacterium]